jgi:flagellar biogenesis protein FliO
MRVRILSIALLLGACAVAQAAVPPDSTAPAASPADFPVVRAVGCLGLVISIILLGFFAVRKYAPQLVTRRPGAQHLKLVETLGMGDKRTIAIIQVEDVCYLVGNTAHQISVLAQLPPASPPLTLSEPKVRPVATAALASRRKTDMFLSLTDPGKKSTVQPIDSARTIPTDLRTKMRKLREALEQ